MELLASLCLPILLSAVFVFVASSIIHMALPVHGGDFKKLPNEDQVLEAMRAQGVSPGHYVFPCPGSMKEMAAPETIEKYKRGPVGSLTLLPSGPPRMGRSLVQWFVLSIAIGCLSAYVGWVGLPRGAGFISVFRVTGTAAVLGYAFGHLQDSIWKGLSWRISSKFFLDGVVYGLVTGATFGWLWPSAA
jgi:hypothetical protein